MTVLSTLKKRIIPKLLIRNREYAKQTRPILVVTKNFKEVFEVGDPVSQAMIYEAQLADELFVLNIDRLPIAQDLHLLKVIERLASETFMPLAVGGGVSNLDDFALVLEKGADKVSINTAAVNDPGLISRAAERFGSQCVVVSIDHRFDASQNRDIVFTHRASCNSNLGVVEWAKEAVDAGAGEILLADADRDGSGKGLNLGLGRAVAEAVDVPVIISGGCGTAQHFVEGFDLGKAEGIAAGTFFCFRDQNPMETRAHVRNAGIPIRIET
jgi:imidazole glycerol-phosphate synthase subunit HisF